MRTRILIGSLAAAAATTIVAPVATADPGPAAPDCTSVAGGTYTGTGTTECQSPGNVQIDATAPQPDYSYPWDDGFYGPAFVIGGGPSNGGHR